MPKLFAWATNAVGFDHVYLTSDAGHTWPCFGRSSGGVAIAELPDANIDAAVEAAGPRGDAGIMFAMTGLHYQAANRILRAANPHAGVTVSAAKGYRVSAVLFGPYGREYSWMPKDRPIIDALPENVQEPGSEIPILYATKEPPQSIVEVSGEISAKLMEHLKRHPEELHAIKPRQFEELIAELLSSYGMQVELTPASKDGGYDLYAVSTNEAGLKSNWIIECKKWSAENKVGVEVVRALYCVKSELKVANALLATTSSFTRGVHDFRRSRYDLDLKDFGDIVDWVQKYSPLPDGSAYYREGGLILPRNPNLKI